MQFKAQARIGPKATSAVGEGRFGRRNAEMRQKRWTREWRRLDCLTRVILSGLFCHDDAWQLPSRQFTVTLRHSRSEAPTLLNHTRNSRIESL